MPIYRYKVMDKQGKNIEGTFPANSKNEVFEMIRKNNYYLLSIEEAIDKEKKDVKDYFSRVTLKDIAIFCRQFYTMLNAGLNIVGCLDVLRNQTENKKLKKAISEIYDDVQKALTFSEALHKHKDVFPELLINMVESGEVSGNLDVIMERMSNHYEKENKTNNKIKSAMIYPIALGTVAVCVVVFLLTYVMPMFIGMFESSGVELPLPTKILLSLSSGLISYWYIVLLGVICIAYGIKVYVKTAEGRVYFDSLKFKIPIVKGTTEKIVVARFTRTLSTLLASGISVVQALEISGRVAGNKVAESKINEVREKAIKGKGIYEPLMQTEFFPYMLCSMIKIGEESGSLDDILDKTANFYDDELEAGLQKMTTLIEPIMMIVMGVFIGFIVISMMMPMFDMFKAVGK